ncbi:LysR substrate-binding domain-containing protein [Vibrio sp. M60_M31a]
MGVPLLMRNRRKVTITAAGELFLKEAISILEMAENAKIKARQAMLNDKSITIGFVPSAEVNVLPEVLPLLRLENLDMQIELSSVITTEQESQILDGQLDVGFMRNPLISPFVERMVVFSGAANRDVARIAPSGFAKFRRFSPSMLTVSVIHFSSTGDPL